MPGKERAAAGWTSCCPRRRARAPPATSAVGGLRSPGGRASGRPGGSLGSGRSACGFPVPRETIVDVPSSQPRGRGAPDPLPSLPEWMCGRCHRPSREESKVQAGELGCSAQRKCSPGLEFSLPCFCWEEWRACFNSTKCVLPPPPKVIRYRN